MVAPSHSSARVVQRIHDYASAQGDGGRRAAQDEPGTWDHSDGLVSLEPHEATLAGLGCDLIEQARSGPHVDAAGQETDPRASLQSYAHVVVDAQLDVEAVSHCGQARRC